MDAMIGFRNVPAFCQVQLAELRQQLKQMAPVPVPPGSTSPSPPSPTSPGGLTSPQRVRHAPTPTTTPVSVNWTQKWWREWVEMRLERIFYNWKKLSPQQKDCKGSGLPSKVSTKQEIERKVSALVVLPWNCWGQPRCIDANQMWIQLPASFDADQGGKKALVKEVVIFGIFL